MRIFKVERCVWCPASGVRPSGWDPYSGKVEDYCKKTFKKIENDRTIPSWCPLKK